MKIDPENDTCITYDNAFMKKVSIVNPCIRIINACFKIVNVIHEKKSNSETIFNSFAKIKKRNVLNLTYYKHSVRISWVSTSVATNSDFAEYRLSYIQTYSRSKR